MGSIPGWGTKIPQDMQHNNRKNGGILFSWMDQNYTGNIYLCHKLERVAEKAMAPHSSTLAWKIHGRRSLVGCSPWGRWGSDTTERLCFHFSLSCIGEGNGNPLKCSCLEYPRDGGAWWAAVYGVSQSQTRLKRLSSSSSSSSRTCKANRDGNWEGNQSPAYMQQVKEPGV